MKKITLLFVLVVSTLANAQAPDWEWVNVPFLGDNPSGETNSGSVITDSEGNIYVACATTSPTIMFGNQEFSNSGENYRQFLVKYDSQGNIVWVRPAEGNATASISSMVVDVSGNLYAVGSFYGTATFGDITFSGSDTDFELSMFVAKFDSNGNVLWARRADATGETHFMQMNNITLDPVGNIYICGHMMGDSVTFDTVSLVTGGPQDTYIAKYDNNGNILWVRDGAGYTHLGSRNEVITDAAGNVYLAGNIEDGNIKFGDVIITNIGYINTYIIKFDPEGNVIWGKRQGGSDATFFRKIAIDDNDNLYTAGSFRGASSTFGNIVLNNANGTNNSDAFVAKFDSDGNTLWARTAGGPDFDYALGISVSTAGNVYFCGSYFSTQIDISGIVMPNDGELNGYVAKMDTDGNYLWTKHIGSNQRAEAYDITVNEQNNAVYLTGYYHGNVLFDNITFAVPTSNMYMAKLPLENLGDADFKGVNFGLYPIPAKNLLNIDNYASLGQPYIIADMTGRIIKSGIVENAIDVSALPLGIYTLRINDSLSKFIKE